MEFIERDPEVNSVGYESLVWVEDDSGNEFSCSLDSTRSGVQSIGDLTDHERSSCTNINQIERW